MYWKVILCFIITVLLATVSIIIYITQTPVPNNADESRIQTPLSQIKTFVINLDRRPDRLHPLAERLRALHIDFERFAAVDGSALDQTHHADIERHFHDQNALVPQAIGCALSHVKVWQQIVDQKHDRALILEDDAIIPDDFIEQLNALRIDRFDLLYLQLSNIKCRHVHDNLYRPVRRDGNWGTTAYIITRQFASSILGRKIRDPIDVHLSAFYESHDVFLVYPTIIKPNLDSRSDLWGGVPRETGMEETLRRFELVA